MHSHNGSNENSHHHLLDWSPWELWLAISVGVAAAVLGVLGLGKYRCGDHGPGDLASNLYHTLQLFFLHAPHLDCEVPWQLNAGRWLSALVVIGAVVRGLTSVFWSEYRLFRVRLSRGHIIVCGLTPIGMQIAKDFGRQEKSRVVVVGTAAEADQLVDAYHSGMAIAKGDLSSAATLRRAALSRASKIVVASGDDPNNIAIAVRIGDLLKNAERLSNVVECWVLIGDPGLRTLMREKKVFPHTGQHYQVNIRDMDFFELAARKAFRDFPLDMPPIREGDLTIVHLVIVGFGQMGQHLALQAARIGHIANFRKLRITVVEDKNCPRRDRFLSRYPGMKAVCDFRGIDIDLRNGEFDADAAINAFPPHPGREELRTVVACWETSDHGGARASDFLEALSRDDSANLAVALTLEKNRSPYLQVLQFQTRRTGFAMLFPADARSEEIGSRSHTFGSLEDTLSVGNLLHEREDRIAQALHKDYFDKQIAAGKKIGEKPALYPWEQLSDEFRDSNRRAADHIPVKLRAIGLRVGEHEKHATPHVAFDKEEIELMARMEHESWCADRLLLGYRYGEVRDDANRIQPYLVEWDRLDPGVKQWDRDQVKAIPEALKGSKYGIYSQGQ